MSDRKTSQRLQWLLSNRSVWVGYPLTSRTVRTTFEMMQTAGLYSFTTHWYDCWRSLAKLIRAARKSPIANRQPTRSAL